MKVSESFCSVCAGTGIPISGKSCVCEGAGTQTAEMQGLRSDLVTLKAEHEEALVKEYKQGFRYAEKLGLKTIVKKQAKIDELKKKTIEPCEVSEYSSRVCERGTLACNTYHTKRGKDE